MRILWVGDAVVQTGFGRVTQEVVKRLAVAHEMHVLGVNFGGDPPHWPAEVYPASVRGSDPLGVDRLPRLLKYVKPDAIVMLGDPWVLAKYVRAMDDMDPRDQARLLGKPTIGLSLLDGQGLHPGCATALNKLKAILWPTQFAIEEALQAGITTTAILAPYGYNQEEYFPWPRREARAAMRIDPEWFVVGSVNRNAPRKRLDLTIDSFAAFAEECPEANARLYLHCGRDDSHIDILHHARLRGVSKLIIMPARENGDFLRHDEYASPKRMREIYSMLDVQISNSLGEGWGLTHLEAMACGTPQIAVDYAALGEWMRGGAILVPPKITISHGKIGTLGALASASSFAYRLAGLYRDPGALQLLCRQALRTAARFCGAWDNLADAVVSAVAEPRQQPMEEDPPCAFTPMVKASCSTNAS